MSIGQDVDLVAVVAGLRALADELESGVRDAPQRGIGMRRSGSLPVVPLVVHHALCGWRVFSRQNDQVHGACAGCGLAVSLDELALEPPEPRAEEGEPWI